MFRRLIAAFCPILIAACASTTPLPLRIDINGQVVDRQFRELVVRATNTGSSALRNVRIDVALPESLPVIGSGTAESMTLETTDVSGGARIYSFLIPALQPDATAVARFPFRTQSTPALEHKQMIVVARQGSARVEAKRDF